ncbi:ABC transporter substrate-binding protein [Asticcacaulis sp. 201]|uniref:ABC transporter substrate-binding protein n=1 Tax=Asticcacaulis sp. 201 TaxID=3028787 RepID=UPI002916CB2B|nr:ABC transporter substrate-binding protein [Asticcacaulis sp. 201]MDV6330768.1 ABC transporter substrate-binding protein [Asticcacaulis sp. 201]
MNQPVIPLVPSDTVWLTRGPFPTGTAIGLKQGWFEAAFAPYGYKVSTLQDSRQPALRSQHFYHGIKTLIREGGNVHPLWTRADNLKRDGRDHTVVVGLTWLDEVQVLLARPGEGESLQGKRLGLSKAAGEIDVWRAMALRAFDTALAREGLTLDDVTLTDVVAPPLNWQNQSRIGGTGSQVTERALLAGEVDIIYAKGSNAILFQQAHGLDVVLDINSIDDPTLRVNNGTPRPITVHRHLLDDHPDLVKAHLQVLNAATDWAVRHAPAVADVIAVETSTTPESVRRGYGPRLSNSFDVNLNAARVDALQSQADFLYRHNLIDARVDVHDWIDFGPLLAAKAEQISFSELARTA